jgi:phosphoribosylformylglycinamidine synthase
LPKGVIIPSESSSKSSRACAITAIAWDPHRQRRGLLRRQIHRKSLVFCGCVGLIPRDKIEKAARSGDAIVVMGGRTGRDGIHGATFSSAELTDTHADEFSHAVQIGNAITEKKLADVILQARDRNLFTGITDCGAAGYRARSARWVRKVGAFVELDRVPLKYAGLRYDEIWISEAQERMVLSVPPEHIDELLKLSQGEDVEATVIGTFGTETTDLVLDYLDNEVARIRWTSFTTEFRCRRERRVSPRQSHGSPSVGVRSAVDIKAALLKTLAHPNIASKHWIIRQYDHEVQGGSVIKPLIGPQQIGPSDAAVLRPKLDSFKGIASPAGWRRRSKTRTRWRSRASTKRFATPSLSALIRIAWRFLDNFCWPSVDDEITMGTLVRACEACRDAALAFKIPFISGKDSLHNQFTNSETGEVIRIPRTLLISAIGVIDDVRKCVTMDLKNRTGRVCPRLCERSQTT